MNDTTIDDLLNELTGNPDTAPVDQVPQAKSALYDLILKEVVGEDEDESRDTDGKEWNEDRNELRQEMRNKLKGLFDDNLQ